MTLEERILLHNAIVGAKQNIKESYYGDEEFYDPNAEPDSYYLDDDDEEPGMVKVGKIIYWYPKVYYAYYGNVDGKRCLVTVIAWIPDQVQNQLYKIWNRQYKDIFATKLIPSKINNEPKHRLELYIYKGKEEDFLNSIPDLMNTIGFFNNKMNVHFGSDALSNLAIYLKDRIASTPTDDDMENAANRVSRMVNFVTRNLGNRRVYGALQKIEGFYYDKKDPVVSKDKGRVIAPENRIQVYLQIPDAEFVTQEFVWREQYNRVVIDKNKFAIILRPRQDKNVDKEAMEEACKACGYAGLQDFISRGGSINGLSKNEDAMSQQMNGAVMLMYHLLNRDSTDFFSIKVYDVKNTRLMDGAKDVYRDDPGLENNLMGIPNHAANRFDRQEAAKIGRDFYGGEMKSLGNTSITRMQTVISREMARKIVADKSLPDTEDRVYALVEQYANFIGSNKIPCKQAFVRSFTAVVCASFGYTKYSDYGHDFFSQLVEEGMSNEDIVQYENIFFSEYRYFMGKVGKEIDRMVKASQGRLRNKQKSDDASAQNGELAQVVNEAIGDGSEYYHIMDANEFMEFTGISENPERIMKETFERLSGR